MAENLVRRLPKRRLPLCVIVLSLVGRALTGCHRFRNLSLWAQRWLVSKVTTNRLPVAVGASVPRARASCCRNNCSVAHWVSLRPCHIPEGRPSWFSFSHGSSVYPLNLGGHIVLSGLFMTPYFFSYLLRNLNARTDVRWTTLLVATARHMWVYLSRDTVSHSRRPRNIRTEPPAHDSKPSLGLKSSPLLVYRDTKVRRLDQVNSSFIEEPEPESIQRSALVGGA